MFPTTKTPKKRTTKAKPTGSELDRFRRSDADRKRVKLATAKVFEIPPPADLERRELLESDTEEWLSYYFGPGCELDDPFTYKFVPEQVDMIRAIDYAITYGGDQSIAASRGGGKSIIAKRCGLKGLLTAKIPFLVFFGANDNLAEEFIKDVTLALEMNPLLLADYPEACLPMIKLGQIMQNARSQLASGINQKTGERYEMANLRWKWSGEDHVFPHVPGSRCAGALIATHGLTSAVRGVNKRGRRPSLAIIDDPDTEDTARNPVQAKILEQRIDAAIAGLGGQKRRISRVMLTTIQSRTSVSFAFTDPKLKPSWKGRRYRWMKQPPDRMDLWETYAQLRLGDLQSRDENGIDLDPDARRSFRFYAERQDEMDAGAIVGNPYRFDSSLTPAGTPKELSSIQAYYNLVADIGPDKVATEYDNDPPEESSVLDLSVPATKIQNQLNGLPRGVVPNGCDVVTMGVDVRKQQLHWVVRAWKLDGTGYTIDYGIDNVLGTARGSDEGLDVAIARAVGNRFTLADAAGYCTGNGEVVPIDLTLVDSGWRTDAVYSACLESRRSVMPCKGFGPNEGATQANFRETSRHTADKVPGDNWFRSRVKQNLWMVAIDSPYWKAWEHDRWRADIESPGSLSLFGMRAASDDILSQDARDHMSYAKQITAEAEMEEDRRGRLVKIWKQLNKDNHWLDASIYANVAASIKGIRIGGASITRTPAPVPVSERPTLQQLAQAARRR